MTQSAASTSATRSLPCVVHLGFAGSRHLFPQATPDERAALDAQVERYLTNLLGRAETEPTGAGETPSLATSLGLGPSHFFCAVSQVAIGADTLLTRVCRRLNVLQRVFLPQHLDAYLSATGSDGAADFSPTARDEAVELLTSAHVIQQRVVSESSERQVRFEDTNCEIARVSDVIVCLLREDAGDKRGGTNDLARVAKTRKIPVLEIRVSQQHGRVVFRDEWHGRENFRVPVLPPSLAEIAAPAAASGLPTVREFTAAVKDHVSRRARRYSTWFGRFALIVILTHIVATILAAGVLAWHPNGGGDELAHRATENLLVILIIVESVMLCVGLTAHLIMHWGGPSSLWADSRLLAEINRSITSLGQLDLYPEYLFWLHLPRKMRPLLRTLNALHLQSVRAAGPVPLTEVRDYYLFHRLTNPDPQGGQIAYYATHARTAELWVKFLSWAFVACSMAAIAATLVEIVGHYAHLPLSEWQKSGLSFLTIVLPVGAVGFLSWAAAKDYEARAHTYHEMHRFLEGRARQIGQVESDRELKHLVSDTEAQLLGETAQWYSRRKFARV